MARGEEAFIHIRSTKGTGVKRPRYYSYQARCPRKSASGNDTTGPSPCRRGTCTCPRPHGSQTPKVPRQARPGDGARGPDACCRSDCLQWRTGERCHAPELVPLSSLGTFFFISLGAPMRVCTVETPDDFGGFLVHESVGGLVGDWLGPARIRRRSRLAAWLRWLRGCGGCVVVWFGSSCAGQDLSAGFSVGFDSRPLAPSLHHRPPIPSCPSRQSANCILHPANTIIAPGSQWSGANRHVYREGCMR
jgi:hypothetical protein